jgi:catechol 2,3-dioxygenase-like lactoylglutathione lyase family enzyme
MRMEGYSPCRLTAWITSNWPCLSVVNLKARAFYEDAPGLREVPKPAHLAVRGGCWFERGALRVHLGVEEDFRPARKAHPAFIVTDLANLTAELTDKGYRIVEDQPLEGYERCYVEDPFGTRIELMEPNAGGPA